MLHNWTNILSTIPRHLPTRLQWILKMIRILGPWPCPAQAGPNNEWGQACPSPSPKWRMLDILRQWMMNGCLLSHVWLTTFSFFKFSMLGLGLGSCRLPHNHDFRIHYHLLHTSDFRHGSPLPTAQSPFSSSPADADTASASTHPHLFSFLSPFISYPKTPNPPFFIFLVPVVESFFGLWFSLPTCHTISYKERRRGGGGGGGGGGRRL